MVFDCIEAAFLFYQKYAIECGFSVRKGSQYNHDGKIKLKYFVCSKEGYKTFKAVDTLNEPESSKNRRRKPSKRTGCGAQLCIRLIPDGRYEVYIFEEKHNHTFVDDEDVHMLTAARELTYNQQNIINGLSNLNIGPVRAFNMMRVIYGGFDKVGATKNDCKNFKREINLYIGDYDVEMVVQRLLRRKEFTPNFSCIYNTAGDGTLIGLFWADEEAKRMYRMFDDVISFDATYRHNRYNLIFVPFTGIDNHNRNVTLGATLIGSETAETYTWLLQSFKKEFGHEPHVVVTDQDPAMKRAIEDVFPNSRHRLCMWHIMDKLTTKIGPHLCNTTDFKRRICDIVWTDTLLPEDFENGWRAIIDDFELMNNKWLSDMFEIRHSWIPAYYREECMSGLMRTSSRSESENHFFGKFCNPRCTLVEFMAHFESAIEIQRHEHRRNDHESRYTRPDIWSNFVIEKQAADIFTRTIFLDIQLEIEAAIHNCTSMNFLEVGDFVRFNIKDFDQPSSLFFAVMFRKEDITIYCSCRRFEQFGLLCRHVFHVMRLCDINLFPKEYASRRWTKEAVPNSRHRTEGGHDISDVVREINSAHDYVINKLVNDMDKLCAFRDQIFEYKSKISEIIIQEPPTKKRDRFAELTGMAQPSQINIRAPIGTRTKGCGSHTRLKSQREKTISQLGKATRNCKKCLKLGLNATTHDSRNHHKFVSDGAGPSVQK